MCRLWRSIRKVEVLTYATTTTTLGGWGAIPGL